MPFPLSPRLALAALVLAAPAAATSVTWSNPSAMVLTLQVVNDRANQGWIKVMPEGATLMNMNDSYTWKPGASLALSVSSWGAMGSELGAHLRLRLVDGSGQYYEFVLHNPRVGWLRLEHAGQSDGAEVADPRNKNPFDLTQGRGTITIWPSLNRWPARKP